MNQAGDHEHAHSHLHDESVKTVNFTVQGDLDLDKFKSWLAELLWEERGKDIFRMKGIISIKGEPNKYALQVWLPINTSFMCLGLNQPAQSVHSLFDLERTSVEWRPDEQRATTMVVIGRHLNQQQLSASLCSILD